MTINHDRRVADVETKYDPVNGVFNTLFATANTLYYTKDDGSGYPVLKLPLDNSFQVKDIYTDFKRHDLGTNFLRAQLGRDDSDAIPYASSVGRGQHGAVWS